jgi:hypothetical protein
VKRRLDQLIALLGLVALFAIGSALADNGTRQPTPHAPATSANIPIVSSANFTSVQAALNAQAHVMIPAATVALGATGLSIPTGKTLEGVNRQKSIITYTGTGCAITLDSTAGSVLRHLQVQVNSASATARGVCLKNTSGDSKWNAIEDVTIIQTRQGTPIVGQVGLLFDGSAGGGNALYWNQVNHVEIGLWDKGIRMVGSVGSANGPNANTFVDVMVYASQHGASLEAYAGENSFFSLFCSASGYTGTDCLVLGDGTNPTSFNVFYGLTSDQGVGPRTFTINANAYGNFIQADSQSSGASVDSGFNNIITELGAAPSTTKVSKLSVTQPPLSSGQPSELVVTAGAHTGIANAEFNDIQWNLTANAQITGGGTIAKMRNALIQGRNLSATSATTITDASTVDIVNAPICGTNLTCTNKWALYVETGNTNFGTGTVQGTLIQASNGFNVASGGHIGTYNTSGTLNICDGFTGTCNVGLAGLAYTNHSLQQAAQPFRTNATIASASTIAPTQPVSFISGTTTISTITAPTDFAQTNGGGCIRLIPTGAWATNTSGNIALASTAVVNKALEECYDNASAKWYPSY